MNKTSMLERASQEETKMNTEQELQSLALNNAKHEAFQIVTDLAIKLLTEEDPEAFEQISTAFKEYKVREEAEVEHTLKHVKGYDLTLYVFTVESDFGRQIGKFVLIR